jgi:phosphatidylglycerol lysyltransferase
VEPAAVLDDARARVLALVRAHGWNATSFQVLEPGYRYWFDGEGEAASCVAYVDTGGAWVAAGAPIGPPARLEAAAQAFVAAARAEGRRACFFGTEPRFVEGSALGALRVGEQPVWDPRAWEASLAGHRSLREQLRRARRKGVLVRVLSPDDLAPGSEVRARVDHLIDRWLRSRVMAPMAFLVRVHLGEPLALRRCIVAEREGELVGLLAATPVFARGGWLLEDVLRDPTAPNGTIELLIDAAMRAAAAEGSTYVTFGLSPLAGEVHPWLRLARRLGRALYDFRGLHRFKRKLGPQGWVPIHLSYPPGRPAALAVLDALTAFSGDGLVRFGVRTLLRAPAVVLWLLGLLLVPWTVLLATPLAAPYFPGRFVQLAWVAFDAVVAPLLLLLARRPRAALALGLAVAVTVDALLTAAQAALFDLPRAGGALDVGLAAIATAAPTFAAVILWRAHRRIRLR